MSVNICRFWMFEDTFLRRRFGAENKEVQRE